MFDILPLQGEQPPDGMTGCGNANVLDWYLAGIPGLAELSVSSTVDVIVAGFTEHCVARLRGGLLNLSSTPQSVRRICR
jgi:hypothetical protein